ncbi:MAG TPA: hypothetical protein PKY87_15265 [Terricaulis sp.]|nr:hypothetical protein [Terricaulis sp.]
MEEIVFSAEEKAIVAGFCALAVAALLAAFYWKYRLDKYEFENRTDGGVVQFRNFGAAQFHRVQRVLNGILGFAAVLGAIAAVFAWLAVFTTVFD